MSIKEIKQRKSFFKEFGAILVRRHGQNYYSSYQDQQRVTVDDTAVRFGRYLRAARTNRTLPLKELADQTRLSEATLIALEEGIILSCDIKTKWLKELAKVLDENVEDFYFLLGREAICNRRWGWLTDWVLRVQGQQLPLSYYFSQMRRNASRVHLSSRPVYVLCSALLFGLVVGGITFFMPAISEPSPPPTSVNTPTTVHASSPFRPVRTEFDLETRTTALPIAFIGRKACCIY